MTASTTDCRLLESSDDQNSSESVVHLTKNRLLVNDDNISRVDNAIVSPLHNEYQIACWKIGATDSTGIQDSQGNVSHAESSLNSDPIFTSTTGTAVESMLSAACEFCGFEIAEVWLRTGPKTHQLINSHLRPLGILEDSIRKDLVEVYYGETSNERRHRLSPALCKRAKEAKDVIWVNSSTPKGAEVLKIAINDVQTAVAVPVCQVSNNINITFIFFSIKRCMIQAPAVQFLSSISISAAIASMTGISKAPYNPIQYQVESTTIDQTTKPSQNNVEFPKISTDFKWSQLRNVEYLTDGTNSWIHTAIMNGRPVVVKTLKPECQDHVNAITEIEDELAIHSKLNHKNIVKLYGAGLTSKGHRFLVIERLDGGTLTQALGLTHHIRDRRKRFWKKKHFALKDILTFARALADALAYLHTTAVENSMVLHRDIKPDNIGFSMDGTLKLMDFGLARILNNASPHSNDVYAMSGETGSLRYMSPEVAECKPYNNKADVYSFGIILWELLSCKKPFDGFNRDSFYEKVVYGNVRPPINRKWPKELSELMVDCWNVDLQSRPSFSQIVERLERIASLYACVGKRSNSPQSQKSLTMIKRKSSGKVMTLIDRHSTWF